MGIRVVDINKEITRIHATMKLKWYNRNGYGTHFGGSLLSMTDPFYALILHANLGDDYIIWDKHVEMDFIRADRGTVHAIFEIASETITQIQNSLKVGDKSIIDFETHVFNKDQKEVAWVKKAIYVKRKN